MNPRSVPSKFRALRNEISSPNLSFLMEAHNGLSAKIVEETGFQGIWASGLTISTSLGVRDSNEASWTQVLEVLEFMADATSLPILMDGDSGFGNFNNVRRLVRKLGERQIGGVTIEDKLFPKMNSFVGERQPLADIEEFCGRIKAGKDSQIDDDFVLAARVEALISGYGLDEALRRAEAYHAAGADAILIHSKLTDASEILAFAERWQQRCPLIIVPTTYHDTATDKFRQAGISTIIWANHNLRASIVAMRDTSRRIFERQSLEGTENKVASVKEVFQLAGNAELLEAERRYLPRRATTGAIVLAAGGDEMGEWTRDRPKCMVDIRGRSLLGRLTDTLSQSGIRDITVVRGYQKQAVALKGIKTVDNDRYRETGEVFSLHCARERISGETVVVYGDVLFRNYILDGLLSAAGDVVVAVDAINSGLKIPDRKADLVTANRPFTGDFLDEQSVLLRQVSETAHADETVGEWIGAVRFTARGSEWLMAELAALEREGLLEKADMPFLLTRMAARHPVHVHYVLGHWLDVDTLSDIGSAYNFT